MEKKAYETAEMEVINIEQEDVICTSGKTFYDPDDLETITGGLS